MCHPPISLGHQIQLNNPFESRINCEWLEEVHHETSKPWIPQFRLRTWQLFRLTPEAHQTFRGEPYELSWCTETRIWILACGNLDLLILFKLTWGGR